MVLFELWKWSVLESCKDDDLTTAGVVA